MSICGASPLWGNHMKMLLLSVLLLGSVNVARAQVSAPSLTIDRGNAAQEFSATSAAKATLLNDLAAAGTFSSSASKPADPLAIPLCRLRMPSRLRPHRSRSFSMEAAMITAGSWASASPGCASGPRSSMPAPWASTLPWFTSRMTGWESRATLPPLSPQRFLRTTT